MKRITLLLAFLCFSLLANAQCASVPSSNDGNGISNVLLGTTNFPTTDVTYFDHTGTVVTLGQGITSVVQITFETGYTYDTNIWIDFNDDLTFDAGEQVFDGVSLADNPTTLNASFVMPAAAALGNHLMRIGTADSGQATPNPCYGGSWGVTLDFTVNIVGISCTPAVVASSVVNADCGNNQYFIDVDVTTVGDATEVTDGTTTWPVTGTGILQVGPFASGTTLDLTLTHSDSTCDLGLGNFNYFCPPLNDLCADAIAVSCGDTEIGNTAQATSNDEPAFCGTGTGSPGVWYSFAATGNDVVTASLCGSSFDTKIQIYSGTCGALTCVGGNDDNFAECGAGGNSEYQFITTAGTQYYIYVFGFGSNTGAYELNLSCIPAPDLPVNDECIAAIDVPVSPDFNCYTPVSGTIYGATASAEVDPSCVFGNANDDVWYTFTATNDTHIVNFQNVLGDSEINFSLFEGVCGTLTETFCSFNNNGGIVDNLVVGNIYYIRTYSNNSTILNNTTFDLCVLTPTPPITSDITTYVPEELITDVLVDADCSTISNIFYSSHDFNVLGGGTGDTNDSGIGYFTDGGSGFPYEEGIVLSSGRATDAAGPFDDGNVSDTSFNAPGDTELETQTGTTGTGDATYIQFDFIPATETLSFNFIMASSEYNGPDGGFQCNFSDSFAFILTHIPTGDIENLAVLPTPFAVSNAIVVTNIHPEIQGQCDAINEQYFGGYALPGAELGLQGRTVPFTAFANVIPGDTYTIKMVVADEGDTALDTAIFLEAGSFAAFVDIELNIDVNADGEAFVCPNEDVSVLLSAEGTFSGSETYQWQFEGVDIAGATNVTYTATELGEYTIVVDQNGCGATASVTFLEIQVIVPVIPDMIQTDTDTDGFMPFDLSVNDILFTNIDPTYTFTYHASQADAENNVDSLTSPYTNISNPQTIVVRVETVDGCVEYVSFQLIVNIIGNCFTVDAGNDQSTNCNTGLCVDLTAAITFNDQACTDAYANLTPVYTWSDASGVIGTGITINVCPNTTTSYTVEAVYTLGDGSTDTATDTVTVNVDPNVPSVNLGNDIITCNTDVTLSGAISGVTTLTYQWQLNGVDIVGETSDTYDAVESGIYTIFVTDLLGCTVEDSVEFTMVPDLDLSYIPDTIEFCEGSSMIIDATVPNSQTGEYTYVWSSGETTEAITVNEFETYTITITSTLGGCVWTKSVTASLAIDGCTEIIPQGISPNNDGINDCFDLGHLSVSKLTVYNRYGTKVYDKINYSGEWCGTTDDGNSGSELPTGTYYYVIELNTTNTVNYIGTLQDWVYINREK